MKYGNLPKRLFAAVVVSFAACVCIEATSLPLLPQVYELSLKDLKVRYMGKDAVALGVAFLYFDGQEGDCAPIEKFYFFSDEKEADGVSGTTELGAEVKKPTSTIRFSQNETLGRIKGWRDLVPSDYAMMERENGFVLVRVECAEIRLQVQGDNRSRYVTLSSPVLTFRAATATKAKASRFEAAVQEKKESDAEAKKVEDKSKNKKTWARVGSRWEKGKASEKSKEAEDDES